MLKWKSINLRVFATIVMKNISLGTNVRRKNSLWPFQEDISKDDTNVIPQEPLPPLVDDILPGDQ
jgi:hypothetical protein